MSQTARPNTDVVDGAWTKASGGASSLYEEIDENTADDVDYIRSEAAPSSSTCAIALAPLTDPVSSIDHVLHYRYSKDLAAGSTINLTIQLRQGYVSEASLGTLIAAVTVNGLSEVWTTGTLTLSAAEADAITNYASLFLRFVATQV